jgi:cob(I)alamin adenosyltransferase
MKKAQIYTTKGDAGETSLLRGERVAKDDARVEAYGAVDELSAWLGMLQLDAADTPFVDALSAIQNRLFAIAASLADSAPCEHPAIDEALLASLEQAIDALEASLPMPKASCCPRL